MACFSTRSIFNCPPDWPGLFFFYVDQSFSLVYLPWTNSVGCGLPTGLLMNSPLELFLWRNLNWENSERWTKKITLLICTAQRNWKRIPLIFFGCHWLIPREFGKNANINKFSCPSIDKEISKKDIFCTHIYSRK